MKASGNQNHGSRPTYSILCNAILLIVGEAIEFANAFYSAKASFDLETIDRCITNISQSLLVPSSMESMQLENPIPIPEFQAIKTNLPMALQETQRTQHTEREQVTNIPKPVRAEVNETLDNKRTLTGITMETNQVLLKKV